MRIAEKDETNKLNVNAARSGDDVPEQVEKARGVSKESADADGVNIVCDRMR